MIVADMQNQILLLVDISNGEVIAAAPITHEVLKWMSVDPLADKYPNLSPYAYCHWSPINRIDPDGRDVYRYDGQTGDFILYQKTDDNFDQIGKFKYDRKTKEYKPILNKDGSIKTYSDHRGNNDKIAKGILRDDLNIKQNGAWFTSDSKNGPSLNDFYNFALILDEVTSVEISGFVLEIPKEENRNSIRFEPYKKNTINRSYNGFRNFAPYKAIKHFHTHGHARSIDEATTPSQEYDIESTKERMAPLYPGLQFLILHNYGTPVIY